MNYMNNGPRNKSLTLNITNPADYKISSAFVNNKRIWGNFFCPVYDKQVSVKNADAAVAVRVYSHKNRSRRMLNIKRVEIKSAVFITLGGARESCNHITVNDNTIGIV